MLMFALALLVTHAQPFGVVTLDPPTSIAGAWSCAESKDAPDWRPVIVPEPKGPPACPGADEWLRVELTVPEALRATPLGVSVGEVHGAYEVFADDARIGGLGSFDPLVDALREGAGFPIPTDALADGTVTLLVHVARDAQSLGTTHDPRVILDGPVAVGSMPGVHDRAAAEIAARVSAELTASIALSAVFLFVALYHVLVWLRRRDLLGYLWFGVFALTADAWISIVALAGTPLVPLTERETAVLGCFVGGLVNVTFIEFYWRYLTKAGPPRRWRAYQLVLGLGALAGFAAPAWTVALPVVIPKVLMPLTSVLELARAARRSTEARVLLVGLAFAALGAPAQWYVQSHGIHLAVSPGQAALAVFFLAMAVALAAQFARNLDDADARAQELAETNVSIQRFVPFQFLQALDKKSVRDVKRGDAQKTTMSVMFCDLRGFTSLSESLGPAATFRFINDYLERLEPAIHAAGGFINQYLGDGIMALFPAGADAAVDAAVGMCRALEGLNAERATAGEPALKVGIGIHTGALMLGTIGGGDQLDSGVVGDVVNTAARLEGITKIYGAVVLISGQTLTALKDAGRRNLRPLDAVKAKGKTEPLALIEVLDAEPKPARDEKLAARGELEAALALYRKGAFTDAAVRFGALAVRFPGDGAARALAVRANELAAHPPDAWDGVLSLTTK